ncbi:hypothetical protein FFF34_018360 [Inquilinus sp. KBS0705]|nr:hypothetical protein FFF34_018360 [Inquilinus sp. KBS0705]
MCLKISPRYIVAFLLLVMVMLELHEMVHIITGRIICGDWGKRDFNVWGLCDGCEIKHPYAWLATLAGPLFSFAMMWLGMFLMNTADLKRRRAGFALIFANIPFGRITQAMMSSGDEMVVTRHLLKGILSHNQQILLCSLILLILGLPPVIKTWHDLANKNKWLYIIAFLTIPLVFIMLYVLTALNTLLNKGFLNNAWIMGTPLLITLHTCLALALLIGMRKSLLLAHSKN